MSPLTKPQISDVSVAKITTTTKKSDEKTKCGNESKIVREGGEGIEGAIGGATMTNQQLCEDVVKDAMVSHMTIRNMYH